MDINLALISLLQAINLKWGRGVKQPFRMLRKKYIHSHDVLTWCVFHRSFTSFPGTSPCHIWGMAVRRLALWLCRSDGITGVLLRMLLAAVVKDGIMTLGRIPLLNK